jgi:acetyltransferase-like isoleucine patch superfamily enzyme
MIFFSNQLTYCDNYWQRFWQLQQSKGVKGILTTAWSYFWLRFAGLGYGGRIATWLATWFAPPYKMRRSLARYYKSGYISPSATIDHNHLQLGANIYIGDRVSIFADLNSGSVELADGVNLHNDICIQLRDGGSLKIGADTHIQPRCQFFAHQGIIQIGYKVQIASSCVFCLGDDYEVRGQRSEVRGQRSKVRGQRSKVRGQRSEVRGQRSKVRGQRSKVRGQRSEVRGQRSKVRGQRSKVRGQRSEVRGQRSKVRGQRSEVRGQKIIVEDDAWIGHGAMILDGVRIGKGAVIGSGAVVKQDIPDGAIAVGVPARVVGNR